MNARTRHVIGLWFVAAIIALLLALIPMAGHAAPAYMSVARLTDEFTLQIIGDAVSCNGHPVAILLRGAQNVDKTCNIRLETDGVSVLFPAMADRLHIMSYEFATIKLHD